MTKRLLFPYEILGDKSVLISPGDYKKRFPMTWKYLEKCKSRLAARADGNFTDFWHGYVYRKNHTKFDQPKILVPAIGNEACFAPDPTGEFYFVGSGGGGGGGYGIVLKEKTPQSFTSLLAILNSSVSTYFIRQISTPFRGGYFAMNRQFIEKIPIPTVPLENAEQIGLMSTVISVCADSITNVPTAENPRDVLMVAYWERIVNGLAYELYFPEDLHEAGIRLFDLLRQSDLPNIKSIPKGEIIRTLRLKFETLYDGTHPLRIALDKLQTLDPIRIIEGQA